MINFANLFVIVAFQSSVVFWNRFDNYCDLFQLLILFRVKFLFFFFDIGGVSFGWIHICADYSLAFGKYVLNIDPNVVLSLVCSSL